MYITLETDYAIRIVDCLVHSDHRMDAQSISEATYVSLRLSLKILRKLVTAGIVQSFKGAKGGYILAREPIDITLRDVIEAVEGPYRFSRCLAEDYECAVSYTHLDVYKRQYYYIVTVLKFFGTNRTCQSIV